jgi:predicted transcriptional regulator
MEQARLKKRSLAPLPRREREVVEALFALGSRASAEEIRAQLTNPPSYSAVRAMLVRLERKGYVRHEKDGPRYLYMATSSPGSVGRAALQHYLRIFFGGSRGEMMTTLLRHEDWSDEELEALGREIDRVRKERKHR